MAGLPTHPGVELPAAVGGGEGEGQRCGFREGKEKGGRGRVGHPMASGSEEGHLSSQALSRPPATPTHRDGAGQGPGWRLRGPDSHKPDLDPDFASSAPEPPPALPMPSLLARSGLLLGNFWQPKEKSGYRFIQDSSE